MVETGLLIAMLGWVIYRIEQVRMNLQKAIDSDFNRLNEDIKELRGIVIDHVIKNKFTDAGNTRNSNP